MTVLLTDEDRPLSILVGAAIAVGALRLGFLLDPRRTATAGADGFLDGGRVARDDHVDAPHARTVRACS